MAGDIQGTTNLTGLTLSASGPGVNVNGALLSLGTTSFSVQTAASAAGIGDGCIGVIQRASGLSLVLRSGSTIYTIGTSAVSGTA